MHRSHGRPAVSTKQCSKQRKQTSGMRASALGIMVSHVRRAAAQKEERAANAWKSGGPMWRRQSSTKISEQGARLEGAALGRALGNDDGASGEARIEPKGPHSWVALEAGCERARARCEQPWESLRTTEAAHPRQRQNQVQGGEGGTRALTRRTLGGCFVP